MPTRLGVDIGGTKVAVALVEGGDILAEERIPTTDFDETVLLIVSVIEKLRRGDTIGVGIGSTGPLDGARETVLNDDTLTGWKGRNLVQAIRDATGMKTVMENDADAALVGEVLYGAGRRDEVTAMLTFGTGVGGAVWTGHGLYRGAYNEHPEIGHMVVSGHQEPCYCGAPGCLESIACGPVLHRLAERNGFRDADDFVRNGYTAEVRLAIDNALWSIAHTFRPAAVIVGGGVMEAHYDRLIGRGQITPEEAPMLLRPMRVVPANLQNRAGVIGASCLVDL